MGTIIFSLSLFAVAQLLTYIGQRNKFHHHYSRLSKPPHIHETDIVLHGRQSGISTEEIERILNKRFSYYTFLNADQQRIFLKRIQKFISRKIFIIKDDEGFKEMPVLVSAAAVQLTLGLKDYLLPFYKYIRIYPEEYFGDTLKVLAGNVQDNTISVAWNHLLKGFEHASDGANVGLHEMSHALYFQKIIIEQNIAYRFSKKYNRLLSECRSALEDENKGRVNLYSDYATTSLQEFWAESVELFFEKPEALQRNFPHVFNAMMLVLNQNPSNKAAPVINS